ncbi:MAG: geranylgeranyl reductase family protein [Candidatus Bipolaricaulia bacterium]
MVEVEPDVLVVGGGPAGAIAAKVTAAGGADTLLVDKKKDPTRSSACGGLVSVDTWQRLEGAESAILNEVSGVLVHPPTGDDFELSAPDVKAYVIDRDRLNADLLARAEDQGVRIRPKTSIFERSGTKVKARTINGSREKSILPEVVIGADGPRSDVRRLFDLERPSELLYGIQAEMDLELYSDDHVEVFFSKKLAPGFFGWIIPTSSSRARVGLATSRGERLKDSFDRLLERIGADYTETYRTGVIPIGVPDNSSEPRVLTVGDAAGQVKPTTGGGLYPISITAELAGEAALKGLSGLSDPSGYYYREWMTRVGEELKREMLLHRIRKVVSDENLSRLLKLLNRPNLADWIAGNGDIDHLYPLAKRMAKNPLVLSTIVKQLPGEFATEVKKELA